MTESIENTLKRYGWYLVVGVAVLFVTHSVDAAHYDHQIQSIVQQDTSDQVNQSDDFSNALAIMRGKLDCSQFVYKPDISYCQQIDSVRP